MTSELIKSVDAQQVNPGPYTMVFGLSAMYIVGMHRINWQLEVSPKKQHHYKILNQELLTKSAKTFELQLTEIHMGLKQIAVSCIDNTHNLKLKTTP